MMFALMQSAQLESLHLSVDPVTGLKAVIAIHNTRLGQALGGAAARSHVASGAASVSAAAHPAAAASVSASVSAATHPSAASVSAATHPAAAASDLAPASAVPAHAGTPPGAMR